MPRRSSFHHAHVFGRSPASIALLLAPITLGACVEPPVTPPTAWQTVVVGSRHTCALTPITGEEPSRLVCWGDNSRGQFGSGDTASSTTPRVIREIDGWYLGLAAGGDFTCIGHQLDADASEILCWGANDRGQLGDGTTTDRATPVVVTGLPSNVVPNAITLGVEHACVLAAPATSGGTTRVFCWGANDHGQLGDGTTTDRTAAVEVQGFTNPIEELQAGGAFNCASIRVFDPGDRQHAELRCWGANDHGQLGDGTTTDRSIATPVSIITGRPNGIEFALGFDTMCTTDLDTWPDEHAVARCVGNNTWGQLANGVTGEAIVTTPVYAFGNNLLPTYRLLRGGHEQRCYADSGYGCVGRNQRGQLGDGTTTDRSTAVPLPQLAIDAPIATLAVSLGGDHACAWSHDLRIFCWGANDHGQLGDGTTTDRPTPVEPVGG